MRGPWISTCLPLRGHGLSYHLMRTPQQWQSLNPSHGECNRVSRADGQSAEGCLAEMGSVTSAFTRSRNTLVKVGSEPQKEPDGKTRSGSGVIAKQTSKQPLARKTPGASRANTPQAPASTGELLSSFISVWRWIKAYKAEIVWFMFLLKPSCFVYLQQLQN